MKVSTKSIKLVSHHARHTVKQVCRVKETREVNWKARYRRYLNSEKGSINPIATTDQSVSQLGYTEAYT